jgi:hypothetical protein
MEAEKLSVAWTPQPGPQWEFCRCPVFEVFYGGARGGGKTDAVLGEFSIHADKYKRDAIGLMIRRSRAELVETIERSRAIYLPIGAKFNETDKMWRFPNGARLRFAYLERDVDAESYQGHSYTRLYCEEIGNFPNDKPILKLMATLRSGAGVPVGFRATGNPGGPGQGWVRARYIDPAPLGWKIIPDERTGLERIYIPSRVADNKYLDGGYVQRLRASGSDSLVRAWLDGDWSAIQDAFFTEWSNTKHVIPPFDVPSDWLRFRSMDWGSASPFSVGWWAVAGDDFTYRQSGAGLGSPDADAYIPRGALVRYREWYGAEDKNKLKGLKLTAEEVADGIIKRTQPGEKIAYNVLPPDMLSQSGGPSLAERMLRHCGEGIFGPIRKADNTRVPQKGAMGGWDQMRARLRGINGVPGLYVFSTCTDFIRTVPYLQHDPDKPEDLQTESEDHVADECFVAGTLVETVGGPVPIEKLADGGLVHSWGGPAEFEKPRLTKRDAEVVRVTFENGRQVVCTPNHLFLTSMGWQQAVDLTDEMGYVTSCDQSLSQKPSKSSPESGFTAAAPISSSAVAGFIAKCGSFITAQYLRASTFITLITTALTTSLKTSFSYLPPITLAVSMGGSAVLAAWRPYTKPTTLPASGMGAKRAGVGTPSTTRNTFAPSWLSGCLRFVRNAVAATWSLPRTLIMGDFAVRTARLVRCVSVERLSERRDVYCLTVPDIECFAIEGGFIVHNCRYAVLSRPYIPAPHKDAPPSTEQVFWGEGGLIRSNPNFSVMDWVKRKERLRKLEDL